MEELSQQYLENLRSSDTQTKLQDAINMIDTEVDEALAMFAELLWENAKCMKKNIHNNNCAQSRNPWFDNEYRESRKQLRKHLRKCRKTPKQ